MGGGGGAEVGRSSTIGSGRAGDGRGTDGRGEVPGRLESDGPAATTGEESRPASDCLRWCCNLKGFPGLPSEEIIREDRLATGTSSGDGCWTSEAKGARAASSKFGDRPCSMEESMDGDCADQVGDAAPDAESSVDNEGSARLSKSRSARMPEPLRGVPSRSSACGRFPRTGSRAVGEKLERRPREDRRADPVSLRTARGTGPLSSEDIPSLLGKLQDDAVVARERGRPGDLAGASGPDETDGVAAGTGPTSDRPGGPPEKGR